MLGWMLEKADSSIELLARDIATGVEVPDDTLEEKPWILKAVNYCREKQRDNRSVVMMGQKTYISNWASGKLPIRSKFDKTKCGLCGVAWIKGVSKIVYFIDLSESPKPGTEVADYSEFVGCARKLL